MHLKEDLMSPRDVTLNGFFEKVDPILDTVDPAHNEVQTATTGSRLTKGQSPYFQTIAPVIVNAFFPGAGTMAQGISNISDGQTTKGVLTFASGYAGQVSSAYSSVGQVNQTAQAIGWAAKIGSTAYAIYDASDKLVGYYGAGSTPVNMVNEGQAQKGISLSNAPGAYSNFAGTTDTTNQAFVAKLAEADAANKKSAAFIIVAIAALYFAR